MSTQLEVGCECLGCSPPIEVVVAQPDIHSAIFGELWLVRVTFNTDFDGRPVDVTKELVLPQTLHGPFDTLEQAADWMDTYPDDPDVAEVDLVPLNKVRP